MQTVSWADQENKRKPASGRAGSVPPRATTPVNHGYAPGKSGVVTPAVRTASSLTTASSAPNKRMKMSDSTGRAPLGMHRGGNGVNRAPSPTKPGKAAASGGGPSSLPRPIAMPMPKPGTQHHALGHGRVPTSGVMYGGGPYAASGIRSASSAATSMSASVGYSNSRYASSGTQNGVERRAARAKRESFRPRPSFDPLDAGLGAGTRYGGFAGCVKEEEEGY